MAGFVGTKSSRCSRTDGTRYRHIATRRERSDAFGGNPACDIVFPHDRIRVDYSAMHVTITMSLNELLDLQKTLSRIEHKLDQLLLQEEVMAGELDALTAQVAENTSVEQSAITLIQNLAAQIQAAGTDPAKLDALVQQLHGSSAALAAAITANTPAAPTT